MKDSRKKGREKEVDKRVKNRQSKKKQQSSNDMQYQTNQGIRTQIEQQHPKKTIEHDENISCM